VSLQNFFVQFAFLYAPLLHCQMEQVTPEIYRGPDPKAAAIHCLHDKGVKTIISLRTNPETKKEKLCQSLGMKWINIKTGVFKTPTADQFDQFRQIVNDPRNLPCYVSCEIDMDRTAVYLATYRAVDQHWTTEQSLDELNSHHPKRWWPIFRKYERVVTAYADDHKSVDAVAAAHNSAGAGQVAAAAPSLAPGEKQDNNNIQSGNIALQKK